MLHQIAVTRIFSYEEFCNAALPDERGVYIWGFRFLEIERENFVPYYVGKHQTSILARIKAHYGLGTRGGNYHVMKQCYLPEFHKHWKSKAEVKRLSDDDFREYRSLFAYLNYSEQRKALNVLGKVRASIISDIEYYQQNFHCCYIPVNNLGLPPAEERKIIRELERHITLLIPHSIAGDTSPKESSLFSLDTSLLGGQNFFRQVR